MRFQFSIRRFLWRSCVRLCAVLAAALCAAVLYLHVRGAPHWILDDLLRAASRGSYVVQADTLKLALAEGVCLDGVRLYRKRMPGQPGFEAQRVVLALDPFRLWSGLDSLARITIRGGLLRPDQMATPPPRRGRPLPKRAPPPRFFRTEIVLADCRLLGVDVPELETDLTVRETTYTFENIKARLRRDALEGPVSGDVSYELVERLAAGQLEAKLDPHLLLPLIEAFNLDALVQVVTWFDFENAPPRMFGDFRYECRRGGAFAFDGGFNVQEPRYRGVDVLRCDGRVRVQASPTNSVVEVDPLYVGRPEGMARGGLVVRALQHTVQFDAVSSLEPLALFTMIGALTNELSSMFTFHGPVRIEAGGQVDYRDLSATDFEAVVQARDLALWGFRAERCDFRMHMEGSTNVIRELSGRMYGGEINGSVEIICPTAPGMDTRFHVDGRVKDVAFRDVVARVVTDPQYLESSSGLLSGSVSLDGRTGPEVTRSLVGTGNVQIEEGRVFMLPVFGGLSDLLTRIIPGLDFVLRQSDADAEFTIGEGRIRSDRIRIEGDVLSLTGRGDYLLNNDLDFYVQVKLLKERNVVGKLIQIVTYPISKLFEFRLSGTAADPKWYPANFSSDLLDRLDQRYRGGDESESGPETETRP